MAIVERLVSDELAALVATGTICGPLVEDVEEVLVILWLRGAVDVDITTVWWLPRLILGESDMAVLLIAKSDQAAGWC